MSRLVLCTSCGAKIDEDGGLCECERDSLERRLRAHVDDLRTRRRPSLPERVGAGDNFARVLVIASDLASDRGERVTDVDLDLASRIARSIDQPESDA